MKLEYILVFIVNLLSMILDWMIEYIWSSILIECDLRLALNWGMIVFLMWFFCEFWIERWR